MKRIIFILTFIFTLSFMLSITVSANNSFDKIQQDKKESVFTKEQKALIDKKSKELKDKYLKNYEKMSTEERNNAIEKYRTEIRAYIKEQFGNIRGTKPNDPLAEFDVDKYLRKFMH